MNWDKKDIDVNSVKELTLKYDIDALSAAIFVRRGVTESEELKFFLEEDLRFWHNPFLFESMEDVVDRILQAAQEEEHVLIFGDRDVDGITSTVIMYETLSDIGLEPYWRVPVGKDSYGLTMEIIDEYYEKGVSLIITVDCGSSCFDEIAHARNLGMDVLVLDHHNQREGQLPDALAIINPKLDECSYPFKGLAACGVVSKVTWALCFAGIETLYKQKLCFLNIEEEGELLWVTAVKLWNFIDINRFDRVLQGEEDVRNLVEFLQGEQIVVYNQPRMNSFFSRIFGSGTDVNVLDLQPEILRVFPAYQGRTLREMLPLSRMARYSEKNFTTTDLLVHFFISYIEKRNEEKFRIFYRSLDLTAVGTIADLMPLEDENRLIVKKGMNMLNTTGRKGLQALLLKLKILGKNIKTKDVSWTIAPVINSAGRMAQADAAVELLLSLDSDKRNEQALRLCSLNTQRREQSEEVWNSVYPAAHECLEKFQNKVVFVFDEKLSRGITGITASRMQNVFNVPAIALAPQDDIVIGSIRSVGDFNIEVFFNSCDHLLLDWGGHECAAGFSLMKKDLFKMEAILKKLIAEKKLFKKTGIKDNSLNIDAEIPEEYLVPSLMDTVDLFEPYGEGNRSLVFMTRNMVINQINFMGKTEQNHLKMLLDGGLHKWPAVFWNAAERVGRDFTKEDRVDVVYHLSRNYYQGRESLQLIVLDMKRCRN